MNPLIVIGSAIAGGLYLASREKKVPPPPPKPPVPVYDWNKAPDASQQHLHAGASLIAAENLFNVLGADFDNSFDCAGNVASDEPFVLDQTHLWDTRYGWRVDQREGILFKQQFMRQVWFPASRLEISKHVGALHVALAVMVLKSFTSEPRNGPWNQNLDASADTAIAQTAIKIMTNFLGGLTGAPVIGYMGQAAEGIISIMGGLMEANQKEWAQIWLGAYKAPSIEQFLVTSIQGETPLPPENVYGVGADDLQYDMNTWMTAAGVYTSILDPRTGYPKRLPTMWTTTERDYGSGTRLVEGGPIYTNDDVMRRYPIGTNLWVRSRLFTNNPMFGTTVLSWPAIGNGMPIRERVNLFARVYRAMDLLLAAHTPMTEKMQGFYTWTDPKVGKIQGSIFRWTPLQDPGPATIAALPITTMTNAFRNLLK